MNRMSNFKHIFLNTLFLTKGMFLHARSHTYTMAVSKLSLHFPSSLENLKNQATSLNPGTY